METATILPEKTKSLPPAKAWTQAEFHQLPEGPPFYELDEGVLREIPHPRFRHQKIVGLLFAALSAFVIKRGLGEVWPEVEVDITPAQTYVPDLIYLTPENMARIEDDLRLVGPPDLAVEVISPSTALQDKSRKLIVYQEAGVPWYWLVEPELLIYEYKNTSEGFLLTQVAAPGDSFSPQLFPGLTFNLAELMGELEPAEEKEEQNG